MNSRVNILLLTLALGVAGVVGAQGPAENPLAPYRTTGLLPLIFGPCDGVQYTD